MAVKFFNFFIIAARKIKAAYDWLACKFTGKSPKTQVALKAYERKRQERRLRDQEDIDTAVSEREKEMILQTENSKSKVRLIAPKIVKPEKTKQFELNENQSSILPPLDLLDSAPVRKGRDREDDEAIHVMSRVLEETLHHFDIDAEVVQVNKGPMIIVFEVQPAPGVKINKITSLSDDIALALKAKTIRIVAPIPGKAVVGIEVPNMRAEKVFLKDILQTQEFQTSESKLTIALGKDVSGNPVVSELDKMPHILIAGSTGSGKTVCVNSLIMSILFKATSDEVKFLMIDPKMVEMTFYNDIPHMITPVVTDPKKAALALNWAVKEMEKRYELFATVGVRNIIGYNKRMEKMTSEVFVSDGENKQELPKKLPYIVIVVDELADLMITSAQEVETAIIRLAQLSRGAGLHIILATQRPSVNVITGIIKANLPCRISFKVSSSIDSRTILDSKGAEDLIGKGDFLFLPPGTSNFTRGQGCFLSDEEIRDVIKFLQKSGKPQYEDAEIFSKHNVASDGGFAGGDEDELYDEAVRIVIESGQASSSFLQRRMRIGFNRAARFIEMMEERGVVSGSRGSKPREVLVEREEDPIIE